MVVDSPPVSGSTGVNIHRHVEVLLSLGVEGRSIPSTSSRGRVGSENRVLGGTYRET